VDRLFLDANVLFTAAHNPQGKAAFLFEGPTSARWSLLSSTHAIEEARRNLMAKYPRVVARLEDLLRQVVVAPQGPLSAEVPIVLPEKDRLIFVAARSAHASHLLTGDRKHFGAYMDRPERTGGLVIQTVAAYLAGL
jgi:predicted nucleic acid-binding protein